MSAVQWATGHTWDTVVEAEGGNRIVLARAGRVALKGKKAQCDRCDSMQAMLVAEAEQWHSWGVNNMKGG
jgi:hypothetical protein